MKFLIIGASGFIGSHLRKYLLANGYETLGTQSQFSQPDLVKFDLSRDRIAEAVDPEFFKTETPIFGVVCACLSQIDRCYKERDTSYAINVKGTIDLLKDMVALGVKPIFISTGSVYNGEKGYYTETDPRSPVCEYGRQKAEVEEFIEHNVADALVLRLDKVIGDDPMENHPLSEWYRWIIDGKSIVCIEGQLFSPTFVDDIAHALLLASKAGLTGIYHVANPEFFTRDELARQFVLALGKECEVLTKPQSEFNFLDWRPLKSYLDSTKLIRATDIRFSSMREVFTSFTAKLTAGKA